MKRQYDFAGAERGKFFLKPARSAFPQTAEADVFIDREGHTIVLLPENIHIEARTMRASRYGKRVILLPIKKKKRAPKN